MNMKVEISNIELSPEKPTEKVKQKIIIIL